MELCVGRGGRNREVGRIVSRQAESKGTDAKTRTLRTISRMREPQFHCVALELMRRRRKGEATGLPFGQKLSPTALPRGDSIDSQRHRDCGLRFRSNESTPAIQWRPIMQK